MTNGRERDLLRQAEEALRAVGKAAIVVKPTLDKPYTDAPEHTPWSRFMEVPARRAYNLGHEIRDFLKRGDFSIHQRVEWNPTGDTWKPGVITRQGVPDGNVYVELDENSQTVLVEIRHLRPEGGA